MTDTPEQRARRTIDANLEAAGWLVRNQDEFDLSAGRGIAVREFPMKHGFGRADYLEAALEQFARIAERLTP